MSTTITKFNTNKYYIFIKSIITSCDGRIINANSILDTGAPTTEFSDKFLLLFGFIDELNTEINIEKNLESKKYRKIVLPNLEICGQKLNNFEVAVSKFEDSWGIDAIIGLDFFRKFHVAIDYNLGELVVTPY